MSILVALLRGVNVGPARRIGMEELRALISGMGYTDVRTVLNSGNVVFSAGTGSIRQAAVRIEEALSDRLGAPVRAIVLSARELDAIIGENPLLEDADNQSRLLVAAVPAAGDLKKLRPLLKEAWSPEALAIGRHAAYLWYPGGVRASRLNQEINRVLGDSVTTRTWATILKLHTAASRQEG